MFIVNKKFSRAWEPVTEAATGETFADQPLHRDNEYYVLDRQPTEDERGGIVPAKAQLMFKKVGGDLYLRDPGGDCSGRQIPADRGLSAGGASYP